MRRTIRVGVTMAILCASLGVAYGAPVETIILRSGQVGGVPGAAGALDDIVTVNPGAHTQFFPLSTTVFTPLFFTATVGGPRATVIEPVFLWMGGQTAPLSNPKARWIGFAPYFGGTGFPGSSLYAVPFVVNTSTITSATIWLEGGADDILGDWYNADGPNLDGLYINTPTGGLGYMQTYPTGFNFLVPTTHFQDITGLIHTGQNYLFFYQRDVASGVDGLIFSAKITVNGCVRTQGYWKNHSGAWPLLGPGPTPCLTLGTVCYTPAQLLAILGQPVQGNGLVSLAYQLIAAELNQANGAPIPAAVQAAINAANALIGGLLVPPIGNGHLQPSQTSALTNTLDAYNNGQLSGGPPHCGD